MGGGVGRAGNYASAGSAGCVLLMGVEAEVHLQDDPARTLLEVVHISWVTETTVHPAVHILLLEFCHLHNQKISPVHYPAHLAFVEALCY